jgi:hypothetical protein
MEGKEGARLKKERSYLKMSNDNIQLFNPGSSGYQLS